MIGLKGFNNYKMYRNITENIINYMRLNSVRALSVQTVQTYGRTYINEYTHTRTPYITKYLVINIIIYLYLFINITLCKYLQNVQFMHQLRLNAYNFSKTFVQTVITPPTQIK